MVQVYHSYSVTGGRVVGTGGAVVMEGTGAPVTAVAMGEVPSGQVSGGMT